MRAIWCSFLDDAASVMATFAVVFVAVSAVFLLNVVAAAAVAFCAALLIVLTAQSHCACAPKASAIFYTSDIAGELPSVLRPPEKNV